MKASSQVDDVARNAMAQPARRYDEKRAQERGKKKARSQSEKCIKQSPGKKAGSWGWTQSDRAGREWTS